MTMTLKEPITVRAGVPQPYGQLITAAHDAGIPVLFPPASE